MTAKLCMNCDHARTSVYTIDGNQRVDGWCHAHPPSVLPDGRSVFPPISVDPNNPGAQTCYCDEFKPRSPTRSRPGLRIGSAPEKGKK